MKTWSKDQQELTRDILSRVDVVAFSFSLMQPNKGCYLDHVDGRFGYMRLEDALSERYRIYISETDALAGEYETIDALIEAGWKVST